jgi:DNA-binding NarL/FixJ family response regulator
MVSIRVVLGDDHTLVRTGVRALLSAHGMHVVAESSDGRQLLRDVREHRPDIALVDISMPLLDGIEATSRIGRIAPQTRVVILTMHADDLFVRRAQRAGAWGYVLKDAAADRLAEVIERVAAGERCLDESGDPMDEVLTSKEREVLQLILEGRKSGEIAEIMSRSVHTVRSHRARLMKKLGARSAIELVKAAEGLGLSVRSPLGGASP